MKIGRILIVCLTGFLLLINTACSNLDSSKLSSNLPYYKTHSPHLANLPYYKSRVIANVDRDFIPYYKSRSIHETNDRNYDLEKVSNKADRSISRLKEDVADKTKHGFYKARKNITRAAENTSNAAQSQLHNTTKATRRAIEDVGDAIED